MHFLIKCSDDAKGSFNYFEKLNHQFDDMFYHQLFSYFKKEVHRAHFNPKIMPKTDIKLEMMDACKESWLLFFEEKIEKFSKGY